MKIVNLEGFFIVQVFQYAEDWIVFWSATTGFYLARLLLLYKIADGTPTYQVDWITAERFTASTNSSACEQAKAKILQAAS